MDPRGMIDQIKRDLESNRLLAALIILMIFLGTAFWLPAFSARGPERRATGRHPATISVLPDPFDGQTK